MYGERVWTRPGFAKVSTHPSEEEVIAIHSGTDYLVHMLGLSPGFYLFRWYGPIAYITPRLSSMILIPGRLCGGIAGEQTGTYPSDLVRMANHRANTSNHGRYVSKEEAALLSAGASACVLRANRMNRNIIVLKRCDYVPVMYEVGGR